METSFPPSSFDPPSSPVLRGKRLRIARMMTGLPRVSLCELQIADLKNNETISPTILQAWEAGEADGLTEDAAEMITLLLQQAGIHCTAGWLLHGVGDPPYLIHKHREVSFV